MNDMKSEVKSRFDEKKPFEVLRAEDFGDSLFEFYEPLEQLIRKVSGVDITGSRPVFLIGGRGTGKTMVLKFLSFEMQLKDYIEKNIKNSEKSYVLTKTEMEYFLKDRKFIAIYLHFRTSEYDVFKDDLAPFFLPYLSLKIAEKILNILLILKKSKLISIDQEKQIVQFLISQIKEPQQFDVNTFSAATEIIKSKLIPQFETIFEKCSTFSISEVKAKYEIPVIISKNIIFELPEKIIQDLPCLHGKNLFILFDELEYLNDNQKNTIAMLIKDSDETPVIFKIGTRYLPKIIHVGDSNEVLQEIHDYRKINITDALNAAQSGKKNDYQKLIKKILNKRLSKSIYFKKCGFSDIDQLFPNVPLKDEAQMIVKGRTTHWNKFRNNLKHTLTAHEIDGIIETLRYPDNPIIEKLNMLLYYRGKKPEEIKKMHSEYLEGQNKQYTELYQKNSMNLVFQLCNDYRVSKQYAGIDVFIHLSSGIIRHAIELCNQSLVTAYNYGYIPEKCSPLDDVYQDMAAKQHAEIVYLDIMGIPENKGLKVQNFINEIGTIFRVLHLNPSLSEPEPTHFETNYSEINVDAKVILDAALENCVLQEKPAMDPEKCS